MAGLGQGRLEWATESGGGEDHPGAKAGSRVRIRARRFARSGQSVPQQQQAAGAQFLGGCRGRRGAALGRRLTRGARASLPVAPGIAPSPSEVDEGRGEPTGAGGPSHQRSAHGPAARRGATPRRPKPQARGAPAFRDTGGVQTPELPANRPGRGKVALALSRKAAVRSSCSSPVEAGNEQEACALYGLSTYRR